MLIGHLYLFFGETSGYFFFNTTLLILLHLPDLLTLQCPRLPSLDLFSFYTHFLGDLKQPYSFKYRPPAEDSQMVSSPDLVPGLRLPFLAAYRMAAFRYLICISSLTCLMLSSLFFPQTYSFHSFPHRG